MKLGLSTYAYTWSIGVPDHPPQQPMTALDLLNEAARLGVRVVQMADNLPLAQLPAAELDAFEAGAISRGIQVEVGTRGIDVDHLRRYLALARRFCSPILRVVVDSAGQHPSAEEVVQRLAPLQGEFESAGVMLAIENHDRFPTSVLAEIVRQLGISWAGICLDTVNSFGALEGPQAVLDELGPLVVNLHVKDFAIFRAEHMMGYTIEGRPAGQGRLDIRRLLEQLQHLARFGNAILELWTPPEPALAETITKEQRWVEASVTYLRGIIAE
jgi:sugar phosphate isomerase/epimerase